MKAEDIYNNGKFHVKSDYCDFYIPVKDYVSLTEIKDIIEDDVSDSEVIWDLEDIAWETLTTNMNFKLVI